MPPVRAVAIAWALWLAGPAAAQGQAGEAAPAEPFRIHVDASAGCSRPIRATLTIPVAPGPLRLHYPKWVPGHHSVGSGIKQVSHLSMRAADRPLEWRRDERDPWAFLCTVPTDARALTVEVGFAVDPKQQFWSWGETAVADSYVLLIWSSLLLYPDGWDLHAPRVRASLALPSGWEAATSLVRTKAEEPRDRIEFERVSLAELIDSPVLAGRFLRSIPIRSSRREPHRLTVCATRESDAAVPPALLADIGRMVDETQAVLGDPPMDRYEFLVLVDPSSPGGGTEHLRSSVIYARPHEFDVDELSWTAETLAHEYVHAWNGKRVRPAGMALADMQQHPDFRLLWVYEGLTTYLSFVVATRAGLWSMEELQWRLAGACDVRSRGAASRSWRSLEDVCAAAPLDRGETLPWEHLREDRAHYDDAALLWLEVDCLLRQRSAGAVSLDDFCRRFFSREPTRQVLPYEWSDLVNGLAALVDMDWDAFLRARVRGTGSAATLEGVHRSGWTLGHGDEEPWVEDGWGVDLSPSIGARVDVDGVLTDVSPDGPVFHARLGPGMKLLKVNGKHFSPWVLVRAVGESATTPLTFSVDRGDRVENVAIDYAGGHRTPRLDQIPGRPDLLAAIAAPAAAR